MLFCLRVLGSTLYTFLEKKTKVRKQKCISFLIKSFFKQQIIICQVVCLNCIHMSTSLNGGCAVCFHLGFSPSLSVAINLKCFVILSDVVLSACAWEYTVHIPGKKQKCISFLIKPSFNKIIICQVVCLNCIHMSTSLNGGVLYLICLYFQKA